MIETLPDLPAPADVRMPVDVVERFTAFRQGLRHRSQIVWAEHCSECAYPTCYAHCAFYTPRADFHCRRFEAGLEPVAGAADLHRIRFRKWGKLEGQGPVALSSTATAQALDRKDRRIARWIARTPVPHAIKRRLAWRWNASKGRKRRGGVPSRADAFVIEAWSSDGERHPFTVTFLNTGDHKSDLYQARFEAGLSYSRLTLAVADIAARIDLASPYLVQIEPVGDAEGVQVVFGICDFVTLQETAMAGAGAGAGARAGAGAPQADEASKPAKVVVWDLDETLWTGVLVEDGVNGVRLRPEAAAAIKMLDERGVLQSIASKNDAPDALAALEAFGLADYFLHPQIHWSPKSGSVAALAKALNLGVDSFVFIDDQPFERAEVQNAHPAVRVLPHTAVGDLAEHPWFDLPATAESRQRRALYQQEARRLEAFETTDADYASFLRACELKLMVDRLSAADVERVSELSQRTNQLNFTGRKYTREAVQALLNDASAETGLVLRCKDRFGDYGLIGFAVVNATAGLVSELFLSCRVQRKRVEHAFVAWLGVEAAERGATTLKIAYHPTGRNAAAQEMLEGLEFAPLEGGGWARPASAPIPESDIVTVLALASARAA